MSDINWDEVTHPFLPNRSRERWVTDGQIEVKNNEDGSVEVTNQTVNITVKADTFEEAIGELNNKVYEELKSGKAFVGRSNF